MTTFTSLRVAAFLGSRAILRGNRGLLILTVALMAVIYAELLFVPSLIQGATDQIQLEFRQDVTASIAISPTGKEATIPNAATFLAEARATPGVAAATATALVGSQITHGSLSNSWPVLAVEPASYAQTFTTPRSMIEGRFLTPGVNDEIVLGVGIAGAGRTKVATYGSSLQSVAVGDAVNVTLRGGLIHEFVVRGIYETNLTQANTTAFITAATAAKLMPRLAGTASTIFVKTARVGDEQVVIGQLRRERPDLRYQSWEALASAVKDITGSFNVISSILTTASLLVAAITVFIVTYVDLINRRRIMGIERAIGISSQAITASYGLKAVVFALIGIGLGAGLFFGAAVPLVDRFPFQFPIGPVTLSATVEELRRDALVLVVVSLVGAIAPAWRAVRIHLVRAIWG
jgi:putative ABC transport system permease protein